MTTALSKAELREFTRTLASEPELLMAFLESMIESVALQADVASRGELTSDEARITQNEQDIATIQGQISGKQNSLPALADRESWRGPAYTPTELATKADLDTERDQRTAADAALNTKADSKASQTEVDANERAILENRQAHLRNAQLIAGNTAAILNISTGKHDSLPDLGAGESWVGPGETPTEIATKAQLDAEVHTRTGQKTEIDNAIGAERTHREQGDTNLGLRIDDKQDSLPALTENQIWIGNDQGIPVASTVPSVGGGGANWYFATTRPPGSSVGRNNDFSVTFAENNLEFWKKLAVDGWTRQLLIPISATPTPTPGTIAVSYGLANNASGAIQSPASINVAEDVQTEIEIPMPTQAGQYAVMIIPNGWKFGSIVSPDFPSIELKDEWIPTENSLRAEEGPIRFGPGITPLPLDLLVTIVSV